MHETTLSIRSYINFVTFRKCEFSSICVCVGNMWVFNRRLRINSIKQNALAVWQQRIRAEIRLYVRIELVFRYVIKTADLYLDRIYGVLYLNALKVTNRFLICKLKHRKNYDLQTDCRSVVCPVDMITKMTNPNQRFLLLPTSPNIALFARGGVVFSAGELPTEKTCIANPA